MLIKHHLQLRRAVIVLIIILDWLYFGFDDVDWPNATAEDHRRGHYNRIDPQAYFVHGPSSGSGEYLYCRKDIGLYHCTSIYI